MKNQETKSEIVFIFQDKKEEHVVTFWKNGMVRGDRIIKK